MSTGSSKKQWLFLVGWLSSLSTTPLLLGLWWCSCKSRINISLVMLFGGSFGNLADRVGSWKILGFRVDIILEWERGDLWSMRIPVPGCGGTSIHALNHYIYCLSLGACLHLSLSDLPVLVLMRTAYKGSSVERMSRIYLWVAWLLGGIREGIEGSLERV